MNNGRMRNQYLSESMRPTGSGRREDPSMSLDYRFATMLFWVTSRVNNCHYCLGHQEQKLQAVGVEDDTLAQLDCDWSQFSPAEQAAFAFTQKLTYHPDQIHTEDLERLQQHFSNLQVLEIVFHVARYNATNRWTDSLGIPQEAYRVFETETSEPYQAVVSTTAFSGEPASEVSAAAVVASRTTPNDLAEIRRQISDGLKHQSRLPLVSSDECRELLNLPADQDPKNWERLLANFPVRGVDAIAAEHACMTGGAVPERLKAQMAFVAAREDRAWYALAQSLDRLAAAGASPNEIAELLTLEELPEGAERDVLLFCRKLTSAPQQIVDADIAGLREHFDDSTVAEIVYLSTQAAFFDRLTLATDLPVEDEVAKSALALLAPADSVK